MGRFGRWASPREPRAGKRSRNSHPLSTPSRKRSRKRDGHQLRKGKSQKVRNTGLLGGIKRGKGIGLPESAIVRLHEIGAHNSDPPQRFEKRICTELQDVSPASPTYG